MVACKVVVKHWQLLCCMLSFWVALASGQLSICSLAVLSLLVILTSLALESLALSVYNTPGHLVGAIKFHKWHIYWHICPTNANQVICTSGI